MPVTSDTGFQASATSDTGFQAPVTMDALDVNKSQKEIAYEQVSKGTAHRSQKGTAHEKNQ